VIEHTRPNGAKDTFVHDALGRLTKSNTLLIEPAVYGTVDVDYGVAGNQVRVTDPRGNVTTSGYNNWGLLAETVEPSTSQHPALGDRKWTVSYDAGGLPAGETRPGGVSVSRVFDDLDRLKSESGSGGGSVTAVRQFTYDLVGRVATANASANQQSFVYDDRGLLRVSNGQSSAGYSAFTYDAVGRMKTRADGAGSVSFGYTDRGEMKSYAVAPSGGSPSSVSLDWNSFGQVEKITYPAGVERRLDYDGAGRLKDDSTTKLGSGVIARRETEYNLDGTPKKLTVTQPGNSAAGIYTYQYDKGQRLIGFTGTGASTYKYDAAGNRTEENGQVSVFDERNRLTSKGSTAYTWSARGSRTGVVGQAVFTFDALDRQTGVGGATYTYDSLDRVIGRSVSGVTKFFNYAGFETDPTSDGTSSWSRSPSGSVLGQTRAGTSVLVGTERHGDVAWTLNPTTGTIADSTVSDPYGKALGVTGTPGQVGFQGDWTDPLSGLVWMAARWYDTQTGTFTSRDTYAGSVGAALTLNRYLYASGSPLLYSDPTGHYGVEEVSADYFYRSYRHDPNTEEGVAVASVAGWTSGGNYFSWGSQGNDVGNGVSVASTGNWIDGNSNTVVGNNNTITGNDNTVLGSSNEIVGSVNWITGNSMSNPFGNNNVIVGNFNDVAGSGNVVVGSYNTEIRGSDNYVAGSFNKLQDSSRNVLIGSLVTLRNIHDGVFIGVKSGTVLNGPDGVHAFLNGLSNIRRTFGCLSVQGFGAFDPKCDEVRSSFVKGFSGGLGGAAKQVGGIAVCALKVVGEQSAGCVLKVLGSTATGILSIPKSVLDSFDECTKTATACAHVSGNITASVATAYVLSKVFEGVNGSKSCNSFTPETLVLMADGTTKPIAEVRIGDEVLATDPATSVTSSRKVTDTMIHTDDNLMDLVVKTDLGIDTIHTTDNHRVWNESLQSWVAVENLKSGDKLKTVNSLHAYVERLTRVEGQRSMHDLTVEIDHTFYVDGGNGAILVHNAKSGKSMRPDPNAGGAPHSTYRVDPKTGKVTHYSTWEPSTNPQQPAPYNQTKRVDVIGDPHFNKVTGEKVATPHVQGKDIPGGARAAEPWEVPGGC
jgi:RHS repeat-associated protein